MTVQVLQYPDTQHRHNRQGHAVALEVFDRLVQGIDKRFPDQRVLIIDTTFIDRFRLPQDVRPFINQIDVLIWFCGVEHPRLTPADVTRYEKVLQAKTNLRYGMYLGPDHFNLQAVSWRRWYTQTLDPAELDLLDFRYHFIMYNRLPRPHRVQLVNLIRDRNLTQHGLVTLGSMTGDNEDFESKRLANASAMCFDSTIDQRYVCESAYPIDTPLDVSLGNLSVWRQHFLHVVSESEVDNTDFMFVTEKTWRPILGCRPFVLLAQDSVRDYLQEQGFETWDNFWPVDPNDPDRVIKVIDYVSTLSNDQVQDLYQHMRPALIQNQQRFLSYIDEHEQRIKKYLA